MRMCSPTASVTGRPDRWISSAICVPLAEAPTTITPPGPSASGLRYSIGVNVRIAGHVACPGGQHHAPAPPFTLVGRDLVAVVGPAHRRDRGMGANRGRDGR